MDDEERELPIAPQPLSRARRRFIALFIMTACVMYAAAFAYSLMQR